MPERRKFEFCVSANRKRQDSAKTWFDRAVPRSIDYPAAPPQPTMSVTYCTPFSR